MHLIKVCEWCFECRYLYVEHMLAAIQASPLNKIATLSSDSIKLMASARQQLQTAWHAQVIMHTAFVPNTQSEGVIPVHSHNDSAWQLLLHDGP